MDVINPTQVVRHASVKMAASSTAPGSPNSYDTIQRKVHAPFSWIGYMPELFIPTYASIKYTRDKIVPAAIPAVTV